MELPVENRNYAIRRVLKISCLVFLILFFVLTKYFSLNILYLSITIAVIDLKMSLLFVSRHTIERVELLDIKFEILYKGNTITIDLDDIKEVQSGLNDFIDRFGKLSLIYRFDLKRKYRFGSKLYFRYPALDNLEREPIEMVEIKKLLKQ